MLTYYFIITIIINIINRILVINHFSNLFFFHAYTVIEALFLLRFFAYVFSDNKILKTIRFLYIVFPLYAILIYIFFQNSSVLNTYTRPIEALMFIGLSMYYWWKNVNNEHEYKWSSVPLNWIITALLFYFSSAFFLFLFSNLLMTNSSLAINTFIWNLHAVIFILMCLLCAMGFYKCKG